MCVCFGYQHHLVSTQGVQQGRKLYLLFVVGLLTFVPLHCADVTLQNEPFKMVSQVGRFEVKDVPKENDRYLVQTVLQRPLQWCPFVLSTPYAVVGPGNWYIL